MPNPYLQDNLVDCATVPGPEGGTVISIKGGQVTLKVTSAMTNDQLGVYEISLAPGVMGADLHYHRFMDETFIVLDGEMTVQHGSEQVVAGPRSVVHVPRLTPHGFANRSDQQATVLLIFNPAQQREGFFHGLAEILNADPMNASDFQALDARWDSYPVKSR